MNVWEQICIDRLAKEEKLLDHLSEEYNRIGKGEKSKAMRKYKVKEIKAQCQKIRELKKEYNRKLDKVERIYDSNYRNNASNNIK